MSKNFDYRENVYKAYIKLKSSIYYDSTYLYLRHQLCEFENSTTSTLSIYKNKEINCIDDKIDIISEALKNEKNRKNFFQEIYGKVRYKCYPKSVKPNKEENKFIINNDLINKKFHLEKITYKIDIPIEAHIIGVLWIMYLGYKLQNKYKSCSYANILKEDCVNKANIFLFEPYFEQYSKWRDKAIDEVNHILDSKKNALVIALDIKDYYYSAKIDFNKLEKDLINLKEKYGNLLLDLHEFIKNIFKEYNTFFETKNKKSHENFEAFLIPIGFLPSSIIANWYLKELDNKILNNLSPSYYGRYVDDILIVLPYYNNEEKIYDDHKEIFERYFCRNGILERCFFNKQTFLDSKSTVQDIIEKCSIMKDYSTRREFKKLLEEKFEFTLKDNLKTTKSFWKKFLEHSNNKVDNLDDKLKNLILKELDPNTSEIKTVYRVLNYDENLYIQEEKIKIYSLSYQGSRSIINNFKNEIQKNVSEFKFLPEMDQLSENFDQDVFQLNYSDTINKLRSIDNININKYNLSKYLAKIIFTDSLTNYTSDEKISNNLLAIFKGSYCIDFHGLWEKVFAYFSINCLKKELFEFINSILDAINSLEIKLDDFQLYELSNKVKLSHLDAIKKDLINHFSLSFSMVYALNDNLLDTRICEESYYIKNEKLNFERKSWENIIIKIIKINKFKLVDNKKHLKYIVNYLSKCKKDFRLANMIRHNFVVEPLFNYTNFYNEVNLDKYKEELKIDICQYIKYSKNLELNLLKFNLKDYMFHRNFRCNAFSYIQEDELPCSKAVVCFFKLAPKALKYSPRFIHLHEFALFIIGESYYSCKELKKPKYLKRAYELFKATNYNKSFNGIDKIVYKEDDENKNKNKLLECNEFFSICTNDDIEEIDKNFPVKTDIAKGHDEFIYNLAKNKNDYLFEQKHLDINHIKVNCKEKKDKLKVALVNMKIFMDNAHESIHKQPNLDSKRFEDIKKLLNIAEKENADIIIFPEISIPYHWLLFIANFARKNQIAVICGLEHIVYENNLACNYITTILPMKYKEYSSALINLRLKNYYSPLEKNELNGYDRKVPEEKFNGEKKSYDLFTWKGVNFACYNCFELANILERGIFTSHADFLVASVHNKDINYYSNVIESLSRDVHCYVIHSNTSELGDSRITKPSKSAEQDIVNLKGGENNVALIGEIDIKGLREFQIKGYQLQISDKSFKPVPPNFNRKNVKIRLGLQVP